MAESPPRAGHPANGAVPVVPVPCPVWEPGPPLIIFTYTAGLLEDSRPNISLVTWVALIEAAGRGIDPVTRGDGLM